MSKSIMQILRDLPEDRKLSIDGEIKTGSAKIFLKAFNKICKDESQPIMVTISSSGGSTNASLRIYKAIRSAKCPVYGVVVTEASSGALLILQAFYKQGEHRRIALEDAKFNLHPNHYIIPTRIFALMDEEWHIKKYRENFRTLQPALNYEWTHSIAPIYKVVEGAGHSAEDFAKFLMSIPSLKASQALEWGLVDEVVRGL